MIVQHLLASGWTVEKFVMYDKEGWKWTSPKGIEYYTVGSWDDEPVVPEEITNEN